MTLLNPHKNLLMYINLHIRDEESKVQAEQDACTSSIAQINKVWTWELDTGFKFFSTFHLLGDFVEATHTLCASVSSSIKWSDGNDSTFFKSLLW